MRTKEEILKNSQRAISKAPKGAQGMIEHEDLMLEVVIDIRDIFNDCLEIVETTIWNIKERD